MSETLLSASPPSLTPLGLQPSSEATVQTRLIQLARHMGAGAKLPAVRDLCKQLRVSPNTLNSALNHLEAQGLISRRHAVGIFVEESIHHSAMLRRVLVICNPAYYQGANHSPFWDLLVQGLSRRMLESGQKYDCYFSRVEDREEPLPAPVMEEIRRGEVAGIISIGVNESVVELLESYVPVVMMASRGNHIVAWDQREFARLSISYLRERGCRRIGFWTAMGPNRYYASHPGLNLWASHFLTEMKAQGLPVHQELLQTHQHLIPEGGGKTTLSHQEQGFQTAMQVFGDAAARPDGLIISDDLLTYGALAAFRRLRVEVPQQVALVTHANVGSPTLLGFEDILARAEFDPQSMVEAMLRRLELTIQMPKSPPTVELLPPVLRLPGLAAV